MNDSISNPGPTIDLQIAAADDNVPSEIQFQNWVSAALPADMQSIELTIRLVSEKESQELNHQFRHKNYSTNVLSFASGMPDGLDVPYLGDLVICIAVVEREAQEQKKALEAHWAHMIVHGVLHLLGYDHIDDEPAEQMESLEAHILHQLGFASPYDND